jgi:hypothetical protein
MFNVRIIVTTAVTLAISAAALAVSPLASAKGGDGVRVSGTCTQNSAASLKLGREDSGIEIEFEVDENRAGVPWRVTLSRNGALAVAKSATTRPRSGSFTVRHLVSGTHATITAVATRASGERCTAHASI